MKLLMALNRHRAQIVIQIGPGIGKSLKDDLIIDLCEEGEASGEGIKHFCKGFDKGEHYELHSHYNIRVYPELLAKEKPLEIAMMYFPCFCEGYVSKLKEDISTSYT